MKKLFALLAIFGMLFIGVNSQVYAEPGDSTEVVTDSTATVNDTDAVNENTDATQDADAEEEQGLHQTIKEKFIEGGAFFMSFVLIALILGLALVIERIL